VRITLSALHSLDDVQRVVDAMSEINRRMPLREAATRHETSLELLQDNV
jgi:hypothetical protein